MKQIAQTMMILAVIVFTGFASQAQTANKDLKTSNTTNMKTYLIERNIPDAGKLTPEQLKAISQKSCGVLKDMGPQIEWVHSYVVGNKIFCVYRAESEELIREHARKGGFPANNIFEVANIISPATAE